MPDDDPLLTNIREMHRPFADAIAEAKNMPTNQGQIGVAVENGDVGVQGQVSLTFKEAYTIGAMGQYFTQQGYKAAVFFGIMKP